MKRINPILLLILLTTVAIGSLAVIAVFVDWNAGIVFKIDLLRSLLIVSTILVGFAGMILLKLAKDRDVFIDKFGMSERRVKNLRIFLSWSIIVGCIAILAVLFYFVTYEISLIICAWITLILQLAMFIFPLIFSKVIVFR